MRAAGFVLGASLVGAAVAASSCDDDYHCRPCSPPRCHEVTSCQVFPRPVWVPDSASKVCMLEHCKKPISSGNRHHCRNCGILCCGACSNSRLILRNLGYHHPERVCDRCVAIYRQPLVPPPVPVVYQQHGGAYQPAPVYQQQLPIYQQQPPTYQPGPVVYQQQQYLQQYQPAPVYQQQVYQQAPPPYHAPPAYTAPPAANAQIVYAKPSAPPL